MDLDGIYPEKKAVVQSDDIDEVTVSADIINEVEVNGIKSKIVVVGRVLGKLKDKVGVAPKVEALYDKIAAERQELRNVNLNDYDTQTAYVAELDKRKVYLDSQKWLDGIKAEAEVTTWTALKDKINPVELEAKVIEK